MKRAGKWIVKCTHLFLDTWGLKKPKVQVTLVVLFALLSVGGYLADGSRGLGFALGSLLGFFLGGMVGSGIHLATYRPRRPVAAYRVVLQESRLTSVEDAPHGADVVVSYETIDVVSLDSDGNTLYRSPSDISPFPNPVALKSVTLGAGDVIEARSIQAGSLRGDVEVYMTLASFEEGHPAIEQVLFSYPDWKVGSMVFGVEAG